MASWLILAVAFLLLGALDLLFAALSTAPFFGDYPSAAESRVASLPLLAFAILEGITAFVVRRQYRRLFLAFAIPGALALLVALTFVTGGDESERSYPDWESAIALVVVNLMFAGAVVALGRGARSGQAR